MPAKSHKQAHEERMAISSLKAAAIRRELLAEEMRAAPVLSDAERDERRAAWRGQMQERRRIVEETGAVMLDALWEVFPVSDARLFVDCLKHAARLADGALADVRERQDRANTRRAIRSPEGQRVLAEIAARYRTQMT